MRQTLDHKAQRRFTDIAPDIQDRVEFLSGRQRISAGKIQNCPRCGRPAIKPRLHTNAMSRNFDIYVCDACGGQEAILAAQGRTMPFREWTAAKPDFRVEFYPDPDANPDLKGDDEHDA